MYKLLIRPVLFLFDPEAIHHLTFRLLKLSCGLPSIRSIVKGIFTVHNPLLEKKLFGVKFRNPVGLAAGFDKDALLIDELAAFGFGFIEIGTLTPQPQVGNDKPRLFRLPKDKAIINRMGFNNKGVAAAVGRLKGRQGRGVVIGGNIGKNKVTSNESAFNDYLNCFEQLYPYVDYFVVNVSSPNTQNLRELQDKEPLRKILSGVKSLSKTKNIVRPILLKIAPDLTDSQLDDVIEILKETGTDGIIATNTTISRDGLATSNEEVGRCGAGGLSGQPLADKSNVIISYVRKKMGPDFPIVGVGGIMSVDDALEKIRCGADLVQIYTGFIYEGPGFVRRINRRLLNNLRSEGKKKQGHSSVLAESFN